MNVLEIAVGRVSLVGTSFGSWVQTEEILRKEIWSWAWKLPGNVANSPHRKLEYQRQKEENRENLVCSCLGPRPRILSGTCIKLHNMTRRYTNCAQITSDYVNYMECPHPKLLDDRELKKPSGSKTVWATTSASYTRCS